MPDEIESSENSNLRRPSPRGLWLTPRRFYVFAFAIFVTLLAIAFPFLNFKFQMMLLLMPIILVGGILILQNPFIGICIFFLLEYGRLDYFFPAIRPLRLTIIIEIVTLLSWIFHLIKTRRNIVWPKFSWLYIAFLGVIASTVITALNNRKAYDIFEAMSIYFMIYFISVNVVSSFKRLNQLIWLLFLIHSFFAVKGIFSGGRGGGSFMGDENDFALAMNMMIPFAFFMFLNARNKLKQIGILLVLITLTLAVISSMSRGGWVGLVVTIVFCVIKSRRVFVSLFMVTVMVVAIISFASPKYWEEIETISDTRESTAAARINYWKAALRMYREYPITGVGADNGGILMPEYLVGVRNRVTEWGRAFHGTLPQVMAELGSLGLIFYLLMLFSALKYLNRLSRGKSDDPEDNTRIIANSIMVSIISYLTTSTFLSTPYYPHLWTLYTLTMILVVVTQTDNSRRNKMRPVETPA